jgi:DNA-cytosine methyltransferase
MNILSLFDGMSCGRIALERAGINVTSYHASELDKYAIQVTQANWPETVQLGDVTQWREWDIDWKVIDLLIGGSPCQGFSFAGKQLAFDDPRSKLFFVYVDILKHIRTLNPNVKFMLENVKMKKEYLDVISRVLGVEPFFINSALVSAQNRRRFYWANWKIEKPEDKGILLADVLENDFVDRDKSHCLDANYYKGGNLKSYFEKHRRQLVFLKQKPRGNNKGFEKEVGKSPTISANSWEHNNHIKPVYENCDLPVAFTERRTEEAKQIRKEHRKNHGTDFSPRRGKELVARTDGKMNCLTATYSIKEHTLIDEKSNYRKLTPIEFERLQTVPDNYTNHVSNTQRYKMLGNGWTVDVIAHIFSTMNTVKSLPVTESQMDLFGEVA